MTTALADAPPWTEEELNNWFEPHRAHAQNADYLRAWCALNFANPPFSAGWIDPTDLQAELLFSETATIDDAIRFNGETGWIDLSGLLPAVLRYHGAPLRDFRRNPHPVVAAYVAQWWTGGHGWRHYWLDRGSDFEFGDDSLLDIMEPFRASRVLMQPEECEAFEALPETLTVWRGGPGPRERVAIGACWTLDRAHAEFFSKRNEGVGAPTVLNRRIKKEAVIAYFGDREQEVVVRPARGAWKRYCRARNAGLIRESDQENDA